ncbi:MAG: GntR family transcriptional regulator [Rhodoplanes sp.]|uniref:GntR family transcriptional regulator n=1 Tax=Rhodoplanes sp. TaxID=1968906 RepID=UPI0017DB0770|nr:GntR family transcriptional regulator [Rhodoplanes sp.]NVO13634.1 GntR family transcriptional regulator [Rhodoplanes sp.]
MSADIVRLQPRTAGATPLKSEIAGGLRALIRSGRLPLGARISDKQLAADLGISRTPVREALVQLQSEGLVVMRPQSGTFVIDLQADDIRQLCAMRGIIEVGALRFGGERMARESLAQLGFLVGRAAISLRDGDLAQCDELDCEFHEAIVATSANSYLIKAYGGIADQLRALRQRMPREPERMARAIAQHRIIVDLWAAGRTEDAASQLHDHVGNVERLLTAVRAGTATRENDRKA